MFKIQCLKCYVTLGEYDQIKKEAIAKGHSSVSSYVRTVLTASAASVNRPYTPKRSLFYKLFHKL